MIGRESQARSKSFNLSSVHSSSSLVNGASEKHSLRRACTLLAFSAAQLAKSRLPVDTSTLARLTSVRPNVVAVEITLNRNDLAFTDSCNRLAQSSVIYTFLCNEPCRTGVFCSAAPNQLLRRIWAQAVDVCVVKIWL